MKNIKYIAASLLILLMFSCADDNPTVGDIITPTNLTASFEIVGQDASNPYGDGSGLVNFTANADNTISYVFAFDDGKDNQVSVNGDTTHRFSEPDVNTYVVTVIASGTGGVSTSTTLTMEVFSSFEDQELKNLLTGGLGLSKTWYLAASEPGHLGVGPATEANDPEGYWYPKYFASQPFEKCSDEISSCLCDDELTFSLDNSNQLTYQLDNVSGTFFNASHQDIVGQNAGEDACFEFDTSGVSNVSLEISEALQNLPDPNFAARGTLMRFSDDKFMGYYVSSSAYEVISVSSTALYVRTLDGNNPDLAWYHKFTTTPSDGTFETGFTNLVWSDEFDTDGTPDTANWTYDLGAGGWGNGEEQTYTNTADNVIIEDGSLKITAKASGGSYTSARLKSENLFEFTYGRVEVRAKLPVSQGTWPAIWMLGANFDTVSWPTCGEMDIMEQTGADKNTILGTCHWLDATSGSNASYGETTSIPTSTSEFHNYTIEWNADQIQILVDDEVYYSLANSADLPFNADFFLILNIAMGGSLGGTIDPAFTEDTMEIDYVRVYQ